MDRRFEADVGVSWESMGLGGSEVEDPSGCAVL